MRGNGILLSRFQFIKPRSRIKGIVIQVICTENCAASCHDERFRFTRGNTDNHESLERVTSAHERSLADVLCLCRFCCHDVLPSFWTVVRLLGHGITKSLAFGKTLEYIVGIDDGRLEAPCRDRFGSRRYIRAKEMSVGQKRMGWMRKPALLRVDDINAHFVRHLGELGLGLGVTSR